MNCLSTRPSDEIRSKLARARWLSRRKSRAIKEPTCPAYGRETEVCALLSATMCTGRKSIQNIWPGTARHYIKQMRRLVSRCSVNNDAGGYEVRRSVDPRYGDARKRTAGLRLPRRSLRRMLRAPDAASGCCRAGWRARWAPTVRYPERYAGSQTGTRR